MVVLMSAPVAEAEAEATSVAVAVEVAAGAAATRVVVAEHRLVEDTTNLKPSRLRTGSHFVCRSGSFHFEEPP